MKFPLILTSIVLLSTTSSQGLGVKWPGGKGSRHKDDHITVFIKPRKSKSIFDMPDFDDIFENATDSMQFINGTSYEVSQTVSKGNNGSYFYSKVIVSISPEDKQGSKEKTTAPTTTTPGSTSPPSGPPEVTRKTPVEPMGSTTPLETDTALNEIDFP
ncbi:uncharacterized protein LOC135217151 isoform X3 [Macrobrachium nipponense]|uniref:uncharacterized protein LOC135217151 isoform X3 n=1 Tax=Macrobrachium nipponense TaxID=159736 RepID=UPI0030C7B2EE